jgi:hypothetical protein
MERASSKTTDRDAGHITQTLTHFTRCFVGERQRQNIRWRHAMFHDQVCDPQGEDARFAAASASAHQNGTRRSGNCSALFGIQ